MLKLSERLYAVTQMAAPSAVIADIGTDHAFVPIFLIQNGICGKGYACDIRKGPLQKAQSNIKKYGLADKIQTRLTDGLQDLPINEIDEIIIAGMGGEMIVKILNEANHKLKEGHRLILQPMTDVALVRQYLYENQFDIITERLASEKGKLYHVISSIKSSKASPSDMFAVVVGNYEKDELYQIYLQKSIRMYRKRVDGLKKAQNADNTEIEKLTNELHLFLNEVE